MPIIVETQEKRDYIQMLHSKTYLWYAACNIPLVFIIYNTKDINKAWVLLQLLLMFGIVSVGTVFNGFMKRNAHDESDIDVYKVNYFYNLILSKKIWLFNVLLFIVSPAVFNIRQETSNIVQEVVISLFNWNKYLMVYFIISVILTLNERDR